MASYIFIEGFLDTLDLFSYEIQKSLERRGDKSLVLKKKSMDRDIKSLIAFAKEEKPVAVIAFNNLGYNIGEDEGAIIWERFDIPYINILMDHPFQFHSKLRAMPKTARVFCVDRNHVKFINRFYPDIRTDFMPHAGCFEAISQIPDSERDIDILYPGNLSRVFIENLIPDFDSFKDIDGAAFSEQVLGFLIKHPGYTTEAAIEMQLKEAGLYLNEDELLSYINSFRFIDGFAVSYFRELSIRILVENGFKVSVIGLGWDQCEWACNPNLNIVGKVSAKEVLSYMKRAKVVLNTLTWFKDGAHDRIFNGMLAGAAVLTDTSGFLKEIYKDEENIAFFELSKLERLPYIADKLLSDEEYRGRLCKAAYRITRENHTWENRLCLM